MLMCHTDLMPYMEYKKLCLQRDFLFLYLHTCIVSDVLPMNSHQMAVNTQLYAHIYIYI